MWTRIVHVVYTVNLIITHMVCAEVGLDILAMVKCKTLI